MGLRWNTKDYKGNPVTWWHGDLIDRIVNFIMHNDHIPPREEKILKMIEEAENEEI